MKILVLAIPLVAVNVQAEPEECKELNARQFSETSARSRAYSEANMYKVDVDKGFFLRGEMADAQFRLKETMIHIRYIEEAQALGCFATGFVSYFEDCQDE